MLLLDIKPRHYENELSVNSKRAIGGAASEGDGEDSVFHTPML